ncbi:zinc-binding dehydrogenase [Candidatus Sumerlaeota bacterium]
MFAKPKNVKAAVMLEPGKMEIREYPFPKLQQDSAIIKVEMCGVCGTDKHIHQGDATEIRGKSLFPMINGHEIIGTIVEIGEQAARNMDAESRELKPGDRVAVAVEVNCGQCWYCKNHYDNTTCANQVMAYGIHPTVGEPPHLRGGFAEYMYVFPNSVLFKIPADVPTDTAVFLEEMAVAYSSLARATQPYPAIKEGFGPGDSVAILGNGPLGILHGIMARIHGGGLAIATDLADYRLDFARKYYADTTINASTTSASERVEQVLDLTDGLGPDLVIESAGEPAVFIEALEMVRKGGTVIEVGNWVDRGETVPLNVMKHITSKNLHIHSIYHCGNAWGPVLNIMQRQSEHFPFKELISHRMGLAEIVKNMKIAQDPNKCMKVEVVPHEQQG